MLTAHIDEVSLIITHIKPSGELTFATVGGITAESLIGKQVIEGNGRHYGVIGTKAVHNLTADEKEKPVDIDSLYIDIGATSREEATKLVKYGDYAYFVTQTYFTGSNCITAKALDNRAGCAILLDLVLEYNVPENCDVYFVFTVKEEVGLLGAKTAAFAIAPDYAVILDTTTAADIPKNSEEKRVCELAKGAVVPFMDKGAIYDKELFSTVFSIAEQEKIPCQTKTYIAGANDGGTVHISRDGVRTIAVCVPCRYIHSSIGLANLNDFVSARKLVQLIIDEIGGKYA
jgi:endoglucanase